MKNLAVNCLDPRVQYTSRLVWFLIDGLRINNLEPSRAIQFLDF